MNIRIRTETLARSWTVAIAFVLVACPTAGATVIDFDTFGLPPGSQTVDLTTNDYYEDGFELFGSTVGTLANSFVVDESVISDHVSLSGNLIAEIATASLLETAGSGFFDLVSIDLYYVEGSKIVDDTLTIASPSGDVVTVTHGFSGTLLFAGPEWEDLSFVDFILVYGSDDFSTTFAQIDNIVVRRRILGDISRDEQVDIGDFTLWADAFGDAGFGLPEDLSEDGQVDIGDFTIWADNFGDKLGTSGGGTTAVPEPSTLALCAIGLFAVAGWGWRQRGRSAAMVTVHGVAPRFAGESGGQAHFSPDASLAEQRIPAEK